MNSKVIAIAAVAVIVIAAGAYIMLTQDDSGDMTERTPIEDRVPNTAGQTFIDGVGRTVTVPDQLGYGIVTIGSSGPLRFASVFDVYDLVIEVDKGDVTDVKNGRAYSYAYDYTKLEYHADNSIDNALVESLGQKKPSLVITTTSLYSNNTTLFDGLSRITTLVVLKDQSMTDIGSADGGLADYLEDNYRMLGKVLGQEDRAEEIVSGIEAIIKDLDSLRRSSEAKVYVAGVTYQGSNELNATFPKYMPFSLTGNKNAYTGQSDGYRVTLNVEDIPGMDIDMIIIDPSSSDRLGTGYTGSQNFLEYVYRINTDSDAGNDIPLYVTVPIVWDSINYDCALASAYYVTHLTYGTLTLEEVSKKIENVFTTFYGDNGKNVLADMTALLNEKAESNGQDMPMLGQVEVYKDGNLYRLRAI